MFSFPKVVVFVLLAVFANVVVGDELLELTCKSDLDCASYRDKKTDSVCVHSSCQCTSIKNTVPEPCIPKQIHKDTKLGDCRQRPCKIINSHCNSSTFKCECVDGYMSSLDQMRCIKVAVALGLNCEIEDQCFRVDILSTCVNGTCDCVDGAGRLEHRCRSLVREDQLCVTINDCQLFAENSECVENRCVCKKGFVVSNITDNTCLPLVHHDQDCSEAVQCVKGLGLGSECLDRKCGCDSFHEYHPQSKLCVQKVFYGDKCSEHSHCSFLTQDIPPMKCEDWTCVCNDGFELYDADSRKCVPIPAANSTVSHSRSMFSVVSGILVVGVVGFIGYYCKTNVYAKYVSTGSPANSHLL